MALWPNSRFDIAGFVKVSFSGQIAIQAIQQRQERLITYFANEQVAPSSSVPEGAFQSPMCIIPPLVGGGMSAGENENAATLSATGTALSGGPVSGNSVTTFSGDGVSLSMIVGLDGSTSFSLSAGGAELKLTIGLDGSATWVFSGDTATLGLIVPFEGSGSFQLAANANLKGLLDMAGESTPYTELSPTTLASAVWNAQAANANLPGSMGEKVNDAGSASNPWTEVIEGQHTAADMLRIIATAVSETGEAGLTVEQAAMLAAIRTWAEEIALLHGLVPGSPLIVGPASRQAGAVNQVISEGAGLVTVSRS